MSEAPLADAHALAESAADALAPLLVERVAPFVLYGHSLGATVAFEVARALRRRKLPMPRALVLSGRCSPSQPNKAHKISGLPDAEFIDELHELAGTPREILENAEMMEMLMPMLRADFRAAEDHAYAAEPPLDVPFFIHGGLGDEEVSRESLEAWCLETTGPCSVRMFPGKHFFLDTSREAVWTALREEVGALLRGPA
jgi:medium-chain acyl-[acyl-carrier-protein] hydrolase